MSSNIKDVTTPYVATYECKIAKLGEHDLLEHYQSIQIILLDKEQLQMILVKKDGETSKYVTEYQYTQNRLTATIGILSHELTISTQIKNGRFEIKKQIGTQLLYFLFEAV